MYGYVRIEIGAISKIGRGASPRPIQKYISNSEEGVNWIKIGDVKQGAKYIETCGQRITEEGAKQSKFVNIGDFILSNSMSFGRPYIMKIPGCIHDGWLSITEFTDYVTSDFLYYTLTSTSIQKEMAQKASFGGAVQNLNAEIVRGICISIPSFERQKEIVEKLDKFDKIVNDLVDGLPAEIQARQQQYEYYRNKLLTFKEKKN